MGIYIDMEMPKEGFVEILIHDNGAVQQTGQSYRIDGTDYYEPYIGEMPKRFTAISVPPHGRCIDVDAMEDNNITYYAIPVLTNVTDAAIREAELVVRLKDIDAAPTIIPADPTEGET